MNCNDKKLQIECWLREYNSFKAGIDNLNQIVSDIAEENMGINYDKDPSGPTYKFNSVVENAVVKVDKFNIKHRIKAMTNIVNNIDRALESLTEVKREIIINRCIKGLYYYQFCYKLRLSERTIRRLKREALQEMSIVIFGIE